MQPRLDEIDASLVRHLQQDGRRPYTQLAKAVRLSEAAVRQRVQRLLDTGVLQIVGVTDPLMLGLGRQAMIGISVDGDARRIADELATFPEVVYVVATAGTYDVICEVVVTDDEELLSLVNERIRTIDGVRTLTTNVYLSLRKQTYQWGAS